MAVRDTAHATGGQGGGRGAAPASGAGAGDGVDAGGAHEVAPEALAELHRIRESIDNIDAALVYLLSERFKCTGQVGRLKAAHGLPPADPAREADQVARLRRLAAEAKLDPAFAEKFLAFIIAEVIHHHVAAAEAEGDGG